MYAKQQLYSFTFGFKWCFLMSWKSSVLRVSNIQPTGLIRPANRFHLAHEMILRGVWKTSHNMSMKELAVLNHVSTGCCNARCHFGSEPFVKLHDCLNVSSCSSTSHALVSSLPQNASVKDKWPQSAEFSKKRGWYWFTCESWKMFFCQTRMWHVHFQNVLVLFWMKVKQTKQSEVLIFKFYAMDQSVQPTREWFFFLVAPELEWVWLPCSTQSVLRHCIQLHKVNTLVAESCYASWNPMLQPWSYDSGIVKCYLWALLLG